MVASGSSITRSEGGGRWNTAASRPNTRSVPSDMLKASNFTGTLRAQSWSKLQCQFVAVFLGLNVKGSRDYAFEKLKDCFPVVG